MCFQTPQIYWCKVDLWYFGFKWIQIHSQPCFASQLQQERFVEKPFFHAAEAQREGRQLVRDKVSGRNTHTASLGTTTETFKSSNLKQTSLEGKFSSFRLIAFSGPSTMVIIHCSLSRLWLIRAISESPGIQWEDKSGVFSFINTVCYLDWGKMAKSRWHLSKLICRWTVFLVFWEI